MSGGELIGGTWSVLDRGLRIFMAGLILEDGFMIIMGADLAGLALCEINEVVKNA